MHVQEAPRVQTNPDGLEITPAAVKSALNAQLYGSRVRPPHPLEHLVLVERAADPTLPFSKYTRAIVLGDLLTALITGQLAHYRASSGGSDPSAAATLHDALRAITADGRTGNRELLGWSWLYYHFVRVDLAVDAALFCQHCLIDPRTLRRYQAHALRRLTLLLIQQEWQVRRAKPEDST